MTGPAHRREGPDVVVVGEALVALVASDVGPMATTSGFTAHVAGAEYNAAVALARSGARVELLGRVGEDPMGEKVMRQLRAEDVGTAGVVRDPNPTALLLRSRPAAGPAEVWYHRSGSAGSRLSPADIDRSGHAIAAARAVHVSGVTTALSPSAAAAVKRACTIATAAGVPVCLDVNMRAKLWTRRDAAAALGALLDHVDTVFADEDEILLLSDETDPAAAAMSLCRRGVATVVLKHGAAGVTTFTAQTTVHLDVAMTAVPVDVVGAGDAFCAGWLFGRLHGLPERTRLATAHAWALAAISAVGDTTGLPIGRYSDGGHESGGHEGGGRSDRTIR